MNTSTYVHFKRYYAELQHIKQTVNTKQDLLDYLRNRDKKLSENLIPPHCLLWIEDLCEDGLVAKTFKYDTVYYFATDDNLSNYSETPK